MTSEAYQEQAYKNGVKAGYSRGYRAGRKRQKVDIDREQIRKRDNENWNRAFLAALPQCINAQGWKSGDKLITSLEARTRLARDFADEAMKYMRSNMP